MPKQSESKSSSTEGGNVLEGMHQVSSTQENEQESSETHSSQEDNEEVQSSPSPSPAPAPAFEDPFLNELGPKGVEKLFRENQEKIAKMQREMREMKERPTSIPEGQQGGTPADLDKEFWKSPSKAMKKMLDETVAPIRQEMQQDQEAATWEWARNQFPEFRKFESFIRTRLAEQGAPINQNTLQSAYYLTKGWYAENAAGSAQEVETESPSQPPQNPPPQHKASSTPLPEDGGKRKKWRKLSEDEKRVARMWNMDDETYLRNMGEEPMIVGGE